MGKVEQLARHAARSTERPARRVGPDRTAGLRPRLGAGCPDGGAQWHPPAARARAVGVTALKPLPQRAALALLLMAACSSAFAQDVMIRNATVHTATAQGTLDNADVLIDDGQIAAVGIDLPKPAGVQAVEAGGRPLTPTLFGGITAIGLEEVSAVRSTRDATLALGAQTHRMTVRPEFDVTLAYNPASVLIPVARIEGIGWTALGTGTADGGSIIGGQGAVMRLDGSPDPVGPDVLYINLGSDASGLSGSSRAAQWMILDQLISEARGKIAPNSHVALLTPAGRATLRDYLDGDDLIVVDVDRAADIRQLLRWADRHGLQIAINGGAEAWKLAPQLAQAGVTVFVDPLANLPTGFDQIGATLENAARLDAAGVEVAFSSGESHNARKNRQLAGNAVANGLPWTAGLAGLTTIPARALGVADELGSIAVGQRADLVLWSGDPLEVNSVALQVWMDGEPLDMRSRQTELRDRYLRADNGLPRAYPAATGR